MVTPDGRPVAMVHCDNGSSDLDAWIGHLRPGGGDLGRRGPARGPVREAVPLALAGDAEAGGLLSINYVSGEHITGFTEGRPLFTRSHDSSFRLQNFVRAVFFASLCALRTGVDILTEEEGVVIEEIRGHGGFFKGGDTGQRMMAAALDVPVSIPATAGEGGAWGMAVLAAYMLCADAEPSLPDYLDRRIAKSVGKPVRPSPRDVHGFAVYLRPAQEGAGNRACRSEGTELMVAHRIPILMSHGVERIPSEDPEWPQLSAEHFERLMGIVAGLGFESITYDDLAACGRAPPSCPRGR